MRIRFKSVEAWSSHNWYSYIGVIHAPSIAPFTASDAFAVYLPRPTVAIKLAVLARPDPAKRLSLLPPAIMVSAHAVFRLIYNTLYTIFYVVLVALLVVTPTDVIYRAWRNGQTYNIWIIAVCYLLTFLLVSFIYATRLYINKTALAAIPKQWIPIEKGDVDPMVHRLIRYGLDRSAAIAYDARPRIKQGLETTVTNESRGTDRTDPDRELEKQTSRLFRLRKSVTKEEDVRVVLPPHEPVSNEIEQPGWGSPISPDLADIQYSTVFTEFPTLIEAKALTLAPAAQGQPSGVAEPNATVDPDIVGLLQRPLSMGLRDYISHLASLGVLDLTPTVAEFLTCYENARFSTRPISNTDFRHLMHLFAEVLRYMKPFDPEALDDASSGNYSSSAASLRPPTSSSNSSRVIPNRILTRTPSLAGGDRGFRTAPTTPKSGVSDSASRAAASVGSSLDSFAQTRHPYPISGVASSASTRSSISGTGSVLRFEDDG
ncbi:hypothetical protein jhhlp_002162 [Lomentospora prolificans]|uniref:Defect at low temperature protein 1 n=1 Tax=Lomentospora prolificans TaxID=41688 RepID=A0A2N3NDA9_9PEZI|nr:hypothetical protein jhhlp_002162 [Lomentospora prolificans]